MRILLVEAGYKNKYPPMGLMKLSTYHKNRGDDVVFVKGKNKVIAKQVWDRVYITTLFTFYFDTTVDTIRFYKQSVEKTDNIYIGGILATIMSSELAVATGIKNVCKGQLTSSKMIGFNDNTNIDELPLDYDILDSISYKYPAGDNYFSYTTRGCPNACEFCAVSTLEPEFVTINNIKMQIDKVDKNYGQKRNLLLLDNNVLESKQIRDIVNGIKDAGFYKGATFCYPNNFNLYLQKAINNRNDEIAQGRLKRYLYASVKLITHKKAKAEYELLLDSIYEKSVPLDAVNLNSKNINELFEKYKDKRKKLRYVDFNQGIDARRLTDEKMKILSELPLRPLRIAFDNLSVKKEYDAAIRLAHKYGVTEMSNYILYNYDEQPFELWQRLKINIDLNVELRIRIFSFPMKYMPIDRTDREYVGKFWNKKYLSAITAILLVTKGVVAGGHSFFEKAFGRDEQDYYKILSLPREFIIYRFKYEYLGITARWETAFSQLTNDEQKWLLEYVGGSVFIEPPKENISKKMRIALSFYTRNYDLQSIRIANKETSYRLVMYNADGTTSNIFINSPSNGFDIIAKLASIDNYYSGIIETPNIKQKRTVEVWDSKKNMWEGIKSDIFQEEI